MLEYIEDKKYNEYKFFAAISGVDLDKEMRKGKRMDNQERMNKQQEKQALPIFRDPDEFKDLSEEEREEMTETMMKKHKNWVSSRSNEKGVGA